MGQSEFERPRGCVVWVHAQRASEAGAIVALTQELAKLRGEPVYGLLTSSEPEAPPDAVTSAAIHQLAPGETSGSVSRFLDHWQPDIGVFLGAPDRPNLIADASARGIPMILAASKRGQLTHNGRVGHLAGSLLSYFDYFLAPSAADLNAFRSLDVPAEKIQVTGPLSDTAMALTCDEDELSDLSAATAGRPIWLAARLAADEIDFVEKAQRRTIRAAHRLLLIVVPDNLGEAESLAKKFDAKGWRTALRTDMTGRLDDVQVLIADTEDEMGLWYRLAPICYLGGTFDPARNATDPFEPAALGSAVVHGPNTNGAEARYEMLKASNATVALSDVSELGETIFSLLAPDRAASLAHIGWSITSESAHVVEKLAEIIDVELDRIEASQ